MKKPAVIFAVVAVIALLGLGTWHLLKTPTMGQAAIEPIVVADLSDESSALILIAENQGFLLRNGLRMTLRNYGNGMAAIKAMKSGEADISLSAEFPIVAEAFAKEKISIFGCIDRYHPTYIVARKDSGIEGIPDLKGKKIGVSRGSMSEFYLGRFLDLNGMSIKDVTLADINPAEPLLNRMTDGTIDAVVSRLIVVSRIITQLGNNAITWPVQSGQSAYMIMTCKNEWAAGHRETLRKFLKSLAEAEAYLVSHPDRAKGIVQKQLNCDDAYMATMWPQHRFSLFLDQTLITAMKDEAQWMIRNDLTPQRQIPDFVQHLYIEGLKEVKSEAVSIIR